MQQQERLKNWTLDYPRATWEISGVLGFTLDMRGSVLDSSTYWRNQTDSVGRAYGTTKDNCIAHNHGYSIYC